jgi:hypothetical protein
VLFDSLLVDTALEDRAADEAKLPAPSQPRAKGQAVRQALPASLPRVEHPQRVLKDFSGTLVTDDYSGHHKLQRAGAITGAL